MSEKQKKLNDLPGGVRGIQEFPWTAIPPNHPVLAGSIAEIGCIVNAYQRITLEGFNDLSDGEQKRFSDVTGRVLSSFNKVRNALFHGTSLSLEHNELQNRCQEALPIVRECADRAMGIAAKRRELDRLIAEADKAQKQMTDTAEKAKADIAALREAVQKEKESTRKATAQLGVSLHAAFFKREADKHAKSSIGWGGGALLFALLLAVYVFCGDRLITVDFSDVEEWTPEAVYKFGQAAAARILGFAVLGYGLLFCARNYTAHRHNAVVNRHRQNALSTYRALTRGNRDRENADIVLTQAARFIYAPQDSGYGRGGGMEGGDVSIFEPVRRAVGGAVKGKENN